MIEDAKLNWALGDRTMAKWLVQKTASDKTHSLSVIESMRLYGEYNAESRSEKTDKVINDQLQASISLVDNYRKNNAKQKNTIYDIPQQVFDTFEAKHKYEAYKLMAKCEHFASILVFLSYGLSHSLY